MARVRRSRRRGRRWRRSDAVPGSATRSRSATAGAETLVCGAADADSAHPALDPRCPGRSPGERVLHDGLYCLGEGNAMLGTVLCDARHCLGGTI
eukprot:2542976-Rhodomonas_salina.2